MISMVKEHIICPVCDKEADENSEYKTNIKGETYYFCSEEDKKEFQAHPPKYLTWLEPTWDGWLE